MKGCSSLTRTTPIHRPLSWAEIIVGIGQLTLPELWSDSGWHIGNGL
jgi:hypothetical protein